MDLATIAVSVVVAVLTGALARTMAAISRNGRETAELRGRMEAAEGGLGELKADIGNAHKRIGGIGRTTDNNAGALGELRHTHREILRHLFGRGRGGGGGGDA